MPRFIQCSFLLLIVALAGAETVSAQPKHGIAMIGEPALPADFSNLPYVNPEAPKGGKMTYGVVGTFDSMNPFIVQGGTTSARGLHQRSAAHSTRSSSCGVIQG